jgi:hypothetical protein
MQRSPLLTSWLFTVGLLASLPAFAAPPYTLPPEQTQGMVTYRRGGIGQSEAQAFAAAAKHYPLTLEFAVKHAPRAVFTADVHVTIHDAHGKCLLDTHSDGPFVLAKLPAGYYTVTAEQQGQTLMKTVRVLPTKPTHVLFLLAAHG